VIDSFLELATPTTAFNVVWATFGGMVIGLLPGLTATMGLALMTSLTYGMGSQQAILVLICLYIGSIYGGSRSAILLNIPGTPANAATAMEGYPMAMSGRASHALGVSTVASLVGSLFGALCLYLLAPVLAELALGFGSFEYFFLGVFGILIAGTMTSLEDPVKGWISGFFGLLVAMIGLEAIHAYERLSFGQLQLAGGIALIPAMVGAFGVSELLTSIASRRSGDVATTREPFRLSGQLREMASSWVTTIRACFIGIAIGIIPGVGEDVAAWISYAAGRRSRRGRDYGKGSSDGLIAAETANSAALPGAIIPALTLAVPGSAPAAVLLAAMFIHNVRPGPLIMIENPDFVASVVWIVVFGSIVMAVLGLLVTRPLVAILKIPKEYLTPVIFALCIIGPYALSQRLFDVHVMLAFGVLGFLMRLMRYPMAPLILGIILGGMIDQNLRRALVLFERDPTDLLVRPIAMTLAFLCCATILAAIPGVRAFVAGRFGRIGTA